MGSLVEALHEFQSVSLKELEQVALLDRMDTKYVFTKSQLFDFLVVLKQHYNILEIDGNRMFNYESLYFDTQRFSLYNMHYCGRMNRYKVRLRKYVESNLSFFEIKFKNNKGRTVKSRVRYNDGLSISGDALHLLEEKSPLAGSGLEPKIWVNYVRITLASKDFKERLTLDLDLTFKNDREEVTHQNLVIAEVKQSRAGQSAFNRLMKEHHIRKGSISKYCFGIASMFRDLRANNFKEQIKKITQTTYATAAGFK
jgi:VTC domain